MKIFSLALLLLLVSFGWANAAPLETYGRLAQVEDAQISPDGKRVALMMPDGEQRRIFVLDLATMEEVAGVAAGEHKVRAVQWADNDNIIFQMSGMTTIQAQFVEVSYGFLFNVVTKSQKPLIFNAPEAQNRIYSEPAVRRVGGKTQIFVRTQAVSEGAYNGDVLMMSDPTAKRSVVVRRGDMNENEWLIDADGKVLVETAFDETSLQSRIKSRMFVYHDKGRHVVRAPDGMVLFGVLGLSGDGASVLAYYSDAKPGSPLLLGEVSIATGEWREANLDGERLADFRFDPATGRLFSYSETKADETIYTFTDPVDDRFWKNVEKAFAGSRVSPVSWSEDRKKVVVLVDSPKEGPAYALVDRASLRADWLGDVYDLKPADIASVRPISYKAADGLEITGYLTVPNGKEGRNLPLVVLPHGGPAARDVPGFDWWSQALASRGYAVLRPNFRGSEGFGIEFTQAGFGEWGRKMQTDLSDGVRHLASEGLVDPSRVCIAGASYGGYAALAGAAIDRGVYRCAVSIAGPSDLEKMIVSAYEKDGRRAFKYWSAFMGVEGRAQRSLNEVSPIRNIDKITIPVLLIHGKDDTVVPYLQSTIMAKAMEQAGKPVELVTLDGEDHWLSMGKTRLKMLQSLVAFLEKHNPPNSPAQTASLP